MALQHPDLFRRNDAPVILGVGKNMVRAIRYWCSAFKVLDEVDDGSGRGKKIVPTALGIKLLSDEGWDPYLEDSASLWLLHWSLLKPPCQAPSWFYVFNLFRHNEFTSLDILIGLEDFKTVHLPEARAVTSSLKKDISCLIRMYTEKQHSEGPVEDSINSPFMALSLIKEAVGSNHLYFNFEKKHNLPASILTAVCLDYAAETSGNAKTIDTNRLLYNEGSPGLILRIRQQQLVAALEDVCASEKKLSLSDSAGLIQLSFPESPGKIRDELLEGYYKKSH